MADLLRRPGPAGDVAEGAAPVTWSDDGHPAAVLFDLDGTLIDSEPLWSAAVGTLVREHGRPWHLADDAAILGWSIPALSAEVVHRGVAYDLEVDTTHTEAMECARSIAARVERPASSSSAQNVRVRWGN